MHLLLELKKKLHIDGLVQDCSNSSALAMELMQSCVKPSLYGMIQITKSHAIAGDNLIWYVTQPL